MYLVLFDVDCGDYAACLPSLYLYMQMRFNYSRANDAIDGFKTSAYFMRFGFLFLPFIWANIHSSKMQTQNTMPITELYSRQAESTKRLQLREERDRSIYDTMT